MNRNDKPANEWDVDDVAAIFGEDKREEAEGTWDVFGADGFHDWCEDLAHTQAVAEGPSCWSPVDLHRVAHVDLPEAQMIETELERPAAWQAYCRGVHSELMKQQQRAAQAHTARQATRQREAEEAERRLNPGPTPEDIRDLTPVLTNGSRELMARMQATVVVERYKTEPSYALFRITGFAETWSWYTQEGAERFVEAMTLAYDHGMGADAIHKLISLIDEEPTQTQD